MLHSQAMTAAWEVERLLWRVEHDSSTDAKDTAASRNTSYARYELALWVGWSDPRGQAKLSLLEDVWPDFPAVAEPSNDPDPSSQIPPRTALVRLTCPQPRDPSRRARAPRLLCLAHGEPTSLWDGRRRSTPMGRNFENRKQAIFKRGAANNKAFTRATRQVTMAVKAGGGDPETNPTLRRAIQNANAVNMPKDRVTSAIEKALGLNDTDNYEEAIYEGYGPHGVAIIVDTATDNVTRTVANVRNAFKKGNGNLGTEGSVSFMFDRLGIFRLKPDGLDREEMELELIDHGLDQMLDGTGEDGSEQVVLRCAFEDFGSLQAALEERKIEPVSSGFEWIPKTTTELSDEQMDEVLKLIARLEDDDDVQTVFHNVE